MNKDSILPNFSKTYVGVFGASSMRSARSRMEGPAAFANSRRIFSIRPGGIAFFENRVRNFMSELYTFLTRGCKTAAMFFGIMSS